MNIKRVVSKHLPESEMQSQIIEFNQQIEIDADPNWIPPPSATCSDTETEIAVESLQRLGEVATTTAGVAVLRNSLLSDLDSVVKGCRDCQDGGKLMAASGHVKAALNVFQQGQTGEAGGFSRTHPMRDQLTGKTVMTGTGASVVVTTTELANAAEDGTLIPIQTAMIEGQTVPVDIAENAMNLLESMEKDGSSDVRVPAPDSQEGVRINNSEKVFVAVALL